MYYTFRKSRLQAVEVLRSYSACCVYICHGWHVAVRRQLYDNVASRDRTSTLRPISRAGDEHEDQPSPTGGAATAPKGAHPRSLAR